MVTSLSDLCAHLHVAASLVVQADRRQTGDRRSTRRGGRRADDFNPAVDSLDMRAVAMRRALASSNGSSNVSATDRSQHDSRYAVAARAGRRILE
jgi:hypothetical protein